MNGPLARQLRVVIESPYAPSEHYTLADHELLLRQAILYVLDEGHAPFASHRMVTHVLSDTDKFQRVQGIISGYAWMEVCDEVWFFHDLGWSPGMIQASYVARLLQKPCRIISLKNGDNPSAPTP